MFKTDLFFIFRKKMEKNIDEKLFKKINVNFLEELDFFFAGKKF